MVNDKFVVTIVAPENYPHFRTFDEISTSLFHALEDLSYDVVKVLNTIASDRINIILGANLLETKDLSALPSNTIIYNFEQLSDDNSWMSDVYKVALENFQVWDYSIQNISYLNKLPLKFRPIYVPLGYCKELERITISNVQDIDVLFYGSLNDRRKRLLQRLVDRNLNVKCLFNVYGHERDHYISRSKLVLNLHYYETQIFEIARVSYLLNNKVAVVSEFDNGTEIYDYLKKGICLVDFDELPDACMYLISDACARENLRNAGYEAFSQLTQKDVVRAALSRSKL